MFSAVFATCLFGVRDCAGGVPTRVKRAVFATCAPEAANATWRLARIGLWCRRVAGAAGGRECHARAMARVWVVWGPGRFAAAAGVRRRGALIGIASSSCGARAGACRRLGRCSVCASGGAGASGWRPSRVNAVTGAAGVAGFEPERSGAPSASGAPRRAHGRRIAVLCAALRRFRGGAGRADSGHVQKAPQSGGAALRAALTAVRCGSGRSRRPTGCWSPLRGSDEMPRGSGRGSPRGERLASPAGSFIDVACIPGAAATAAEGAAADRASRKAFRR